MKYSLLALLVLTACQTKRLTNVVYRETPVITQPATATECPYGGIEYTIGGHTAVICNGSDGVTIVGPSGPAGNDGSSCTASQISTGAIITCSDGTSAYIANGTVGPAGADAPPTASSTIVPLCTTPTVYPTVFSEVGICLGGKLYGVYSDHGGFMVEIVPGAYYSNGINSSCNLTVQPNCVVTH